jgi:hypothetical protein
MLETIAPNVPWNTLPATDSWSGSPVQSCFPGDRVRIRRGPLAGLRGVLVAPCDQERWLIEALDSSPGLYLCISEDLLAAESA